MSATLHLICGKIAAGKSSLAAELGRQTGTVMLSEDFLLARLYPGEIETIDDYSRCAGRLCDAIRPHVVQLLKTGTSVVLDFQANTVQRRAWMRSLIDESACAHRLHYLDVADAVCKDRLHKRNAAGTHDYVVSDAEFDLFTSYFVPPSPEEGFNVVVVT